MAWKLFTREEAVTIVAETVGQSGHRGQFRIDGLDYRRKN
jgi:hypothetical protein